MGWSSYHVDDGFDRKAEIDEKYNWEEGGKKVSVLKSQMVGSTYYAAVKVEENGEARVRASVVLTWKDNRRWDNFGYKAMDESFGPGESKCPVGILKLLTPTDNEDANAWRERCWKYHEQKKSSRSLRNLPYGAVIEFDWWGEKKRVVKRRPAFQFKNDWWQVCGSNRYWAKKRIPDDYTVVSGAVTVG